jgi:L-fuconolactonase
LDRRTAIKAGAAALSMAASFPGVTDTAARVPIIDSHIHLFDPNRPQGTPALIPGSPTSTTGSFPGPYRHWAEPLGVVGAIHIEASNWVEDNLWALEVARSNDIMVGVIGNLDPEKPEFDEYLERFHRDPLFRGIRYGNIWNYDLARGSKRADVMARLRRLAAADLVMDSATPDIDLLSAIVRVNDAIPELRIVIDHLPGFDPAPRSQGAYQRILQELRGRENVYVKLSQIIHRRNGVVSTDLADYREALDLIVSSFGTHRVMFGSDYPNSDMVTTPSHVFRIAREYLAQRPLEVQESCFYRTAWRVYKCQRRTGQQRLLARDAQS